MNGKLFLHAAFTHPLSGGRELRSAHPEVSWTDVIALRNPVHRTIRVNPGDGAGVTEHIGHWLTGCGLDS